MGFREWGKNGDQNLDTYMMRKKEKHVELVQLRKIIYRDGKTGFELYKGYCKNGDWVGLMKYSAVDINREGEVVDWCQSQSWNGKDDTDFKSLFD